MLEVLEREAAGIFRNGGRWTCALFAELVRQWRAWKRGVPPTREWRGRGAQNPVLLAAFDALDRAEVQARQPLGPGPGDSTLSFEARILRKLGTR